jgi:DNA-directed RNA polymerase specialized sigma24 family protein
MRPGRVSTRLSVPAVAAPGQERTVVRNEPLPVRAEDVALMAVLERLCPLERVVFVLRNAFDLIFDEIASVVHLLYARIVQGAHHVLHKLLSMRLRRPLLRHLVPPAHHHEAV